MKVCGLKREKDVLACVDAGADALGFIVGFPDSPRNISLGRATELARLVPPFVDRVLVTKASLVASTMGGVVGFRPGALQVYGDGVDLELVRRETGAALIRPYAVGVRDADPAGQVEGYDALLTDTYVRGMDGGSGIKSDWSACRKIRHAIAPTPLVLSGGLSPENVVEAIRSVRPFAVDVSSGVESAPGKKDGSRVALFVSKAKEASR